MPVTVSDTNRDTLAIAAMRTRVATITGLWPIQQHNDPAPTTSPGVRSGYIVETPVGGPAPLAEISNGTNTPLLREFTRQWQLLLHCPVGDGLDAIAQSNAINAALNESPITIAASDSDGPITVMILDVAQKGARPPAGSLAYWTTPVVVLYRFSSAH